MVLLAALAAAAPAATGAEPVAVVVHPSVPQQALDAPTLLDIYTGQVKTWGDGAPIVLVDLKNKTEVKRAFYSFLGMTASRMKSIWMKNLLAGEGSPPESIDDEEALLQRVATTPGAMGYVSLARARQTEGVHILLEIPDDQK
jgi:ABC-type phosphate transport system substrate-binding protein